MPKKTAPSKGGKKRPGPKPIPKARPNNPKASYLPPPGTRSVDGGTNNNRTQAMSDAQKSAAVLGAPPQPAKKKKKPRAFKKKIIPANATEYMKFRLEFMNKYPKLMRGKSKSERTNIIKKAWGKKLEKPTDGMTPYILFRTKYINEHRPEMKGKSKREKTAMIKSAWKDTSKYQKFKLQYICKNYDGLQIMDEKAKTAAIKNAWTKKKQEMTKEVKGKGAKGVRKTLSAAKVAEKNAKDQKRREKKHKEWLRKLGRTQVPVAEGTKVSDYIVFRYGYMDINRDRFEHMKEKERTDIIKTEWNKQKKKEEIRAIARITKRKREEVVKIEAEKEKKAGKVSEIKAVGAYEKGELTPYQIFRSGYRLLYGLDLAKKETTDKIKLAWRAYQAEYLKEITQKMKRDKDLSREKRRLLKLATKRKKRKRPKSAQPVQPRPKTPAGTPSPYMNFRKKYLEDNKEAFAGLSEREVTSKVKIAWWEDAPNRKNVDGASSRPAKKKKKTPKAKRARAAVV